MSTPMNSHENKDNQTDKNQQGTSLYKPHSTYNQRLFNNDTNDDLPQDDNEQLPLFEPLDTKYYHPDTENNPAQETSTTHDMSKQSEAYSTPAPQQEEDLTDYSQYGAPSAPQDTYQNASIDQYPDELINSKGKPSNWPDFLIEENNQKFYGLASLLGGFATSGIIGLAMAIYYLFILDDSIEKDKGAKIMNWIAFITPLIVYTLTFIGFILFMIMGFAVNAI